MRGGLGAPQQNRVSGAAQKRWARMHAREAHVKSCNGFGFSGTTGAMDNKVLDAPAVSMYYVAAGRIAQLEERWPYKPEVTGSSPVPPILRRLHYVAF